MNKYIEKISDFLKANNIEPEIQEFSESTRTARDAADVLKCNVSQIAKSLIFKTKQSNQPILIIASGINRVDLNKVSALLNEDLEKPDADFVKEHTGYQIGGVPPVAHIKQLTTFIDEDLFNLDIIYPAAGTANSIFKTTPQELTTLTKGQVANIKEDK